MGALSKAVIPIEDFAKEILSDLPQLYSIYPKGITVAVMQEEYGESPQRILRALSILERDKHVQISRQGEDPNHLQPTIETPTSIAKKESPYGSLSELQRRTITYLVDLCQASKTDRVRTNYGQLARILNASSGGIRTCIARLSALGYLVVESPSQHGSQNSLILRILPSNPNLPS
jgi:hypothetical protein